MDSIVHIWDQNLQRINQYDLQGNYAHQIPLKGITSAVKIAEVGRQRLLFYPERHRPPFDSSRIGQLYNTDFGEVVAHFLQVGEINTELEEINPIINMSIGRSIEVISPNTILYATPIYNNKIYEYSLQNSGDWALSAAHKGLLDQQPFTTVEGTSGRQPDVGYHSSHLDEPLEIIAHNQSRGLFKVQNYIFHFLQVDIGEKREFGAEVYTDNFDPIGFIPIYSIPITTKKRNSLYWFVAEADSRGNFYFGENYPDSSRVRKMHLDLAALEEYK